MVPNVETFTSVATYHPDGSYVNESLLGSLEWSIQDGRVAVEDYPPHLSRRTENWGWVNVALLTCRLAFVLYGGGKQRASSSITTMAGHTDPTHFYIATL